MKIIDYLTPKPARFFLLAALFWGGLMCFLNYKDGARFKWHDLLVEANGMFFDLLVFGILLSIYEALREKKERIERLHEEIDDYRGWDEKEAMYRIVGAVKRLNKLGISNIDLTDCFLWKAKLDRLNLKDADLRYADLTEATLRYANLKGAHLILANLTKTNLSGADFTRADLRGANLTEADFGKTTRRSKEAILTDAHVDTNWFEKLENWKVSGREGIIDKYQIDAKGKLQLK